MVQRRQMSCHWLPINPLGIHERINLLLWIDRCWVAEHFAEHLEKLKTIGAGLTSTEMALFELMKTAEHPRFREISKIVK